VSAPSGAYPQGDVSPPALEPGAVVEFWFSDRARTLWFEKDHEFDDEIRRRFGADVDAAQAGAFADWCDSAEGTLALLILLDQMARNIHRGSPRAFAGDARALAIAMQAVAQGIDRGFDFSHRRFFYLPFEHSEEPTVQARSLQLFADLAATCAPHEKEEAEDQYVYAQRHADIIARFGRYPHRNDCLGRVCTAEELAFLAGPDSSF
jgi:uncharacterized protein (DUF924 family)